MNRLLVLSGVAGVFLLLGGCTAAPVNPVVDGGGVDAGPSSAQVEAGRVWVSAHGCAGCHQVDPSGPMTLGGNPNGLPGTKVYAPNLTPDLETGIGLWSDEEVLNAVRTGMSDEGVPLCPQMPRYSTLDDATGAAMVAYLRSLPPLALKVPEGTCTATVSEADHGAQLANQYGCASCHTDQAAGSAPLAGRDAPFPGTQVYAPNITPDSDTGIGGWTDDDIISAIRVGVDDEGDTLCAKMPRFGSLSDADAKALVAYLRSLSPVRHDVPSSVCAERPAVDVDAGPADVDAGLPDAGPVDAGLPDAGHPDAGAVDAGHPDAGHPDAGHLDAGQVDAGHVDAGHVDAGSVLPLPDAGALGTWTRLTAGVALPPPWVVTNFVPLATQSPSTEAMDHANTLVQVPGTLTTSVTPCPLPYVTSTKTLCDGFTATGSTGPLVINDYQYLGATPTCATSLPPVGPLGTTTGVWETHYDYPTQVTTWVLSPTTCADLGLGTTTPGTGHVASTTDIAQALTPFPTTLRVVAVRGVVVATHLATSSYSFVIQDPLGGPHSGASVVKKKKTGVALGTPPAIGDYVLVTGTATVTAAGHPEVDL